MPRKNLPPHIPYNKSLVPKAKELRNQLTPPERQFWKALRQMPSYKNHPFNRQKPLGEYIVDFYCHEYRLVIEIDGDSHGTEEAKTKDQKRTAFLESKGLRVVRFTNREVGRNIEGVMDSLENLLNKIKEEAP
ncbi:MAG: endonuclease domain-containing protein [Nitrospinota bacterium]|nr:endonuclease domain-containing protein [Nitrospinota bacterium]